MQTLRHILDSLVESGAIDAEYDRADHIARYRLSEEAEQQLRVQRAARMPSRASRRRKEQIASAIGGAA